MTNVLARDRQRDRTGQDTDTEEKATGSWGEGCSRKPRSAGSHRELEEASKDSPLWRV